MLEVAIRGGMRGHGADAQFPAGAQDAQGNFPAVGDDDFFEHGGGYSMTSSGWSNSTGWPFSTRMRVTAPA